MAHEAVGGDDQETAVGDHLRADRERHHLQDDRLGEAVAAAENGDGHFLPLRRLAVEADPAVQHDEEAAGGLTLQEQHRLTAERLGEGISSSGASAGGDNPSNTGVRRTSSSSARLRPLRRAMGGHASPAFVTVAPAKPASLPRDRRIVTRRTRWQDSAQPCAAGRPRPPVAPRACGARSAAGTPGRWRSSPGSSGSGCIRRDGSAPRAVWRRLDIGRRRSGIRRRTGGDASVTRTGAAAPAGPAPHRAGTDSGTRPRRRPPAQQQRPVVQDIEQKSRRPQ